MLTPLAETIRDHWRALRADYPVLNGWTLVINGRMRSAMGRCKYRDRELHLARWHVRQSSSDEVIDTLLHEAAHALAGQHGHGREWKAWARRLGATPRAKGDCRNRDAPPPKWRVRCLACGARFERRRRRADWFQMHHRCDDGGCGRLRWEDRRNGGRAAVGYDPARPAVEVGRTLESPNRNGRR